MPTGCWPTAGAADVPPLLAGREEADALLLRLALAYRQTGDARLADAARQLQGDLPTHSPAATPAMPASAHVLPSASSTMPPAH